MKINKEIKNCGECIFHFNVLSRGKKWSQCDLDTFNREIDLDNIPSWCPLLEIVEDK